nr:hypothetical protein CFP56_50791 [Quercus suber]
MHIEGDRGRRVDTTFLRRRNLLTLLAMGLQRAVETSTSDALCDLNRYSTPIVRCSVPPVETETADGQTLVARHLNKLISMATASESNVEDRLKAFFPVLSNLPLLEMQDNVSWKQIIREKHQ